MKENEGRFSRFEAIDWWDQSLLRKARILVIGAGALGNETIKNLALLGAGHITIVDMDRIETSNLSRSVLFRPHDEGQSKADSAARAVASIYPEIQARAIVGNVIADVGLGYFRWAQVVVGALDNREARVFVNSICARIGRPWIDGGIEVLNGIVRGFAPPVTACYECTMSEIDWQLLNEQRSCSLLAGRAYANMGVPTTPTTASVIGGIQAQEVVKILHGMDALLGRGYIFEGAAHSSYCVKYAIKSGCEKHNPPAPVEAVMEFSSATLLQEIWDWAARRLSGLDALDLGREIVSRVDCMACGWTAPVYKAACIVRREDITCGSCGGECSPSFFHSIGSANDELSLSVHELGLPRWDIIWARYGDKSIGIELTGDRPTGVPA